MMPPAGLRVVVLQSSGMRSTDVHCRWCQFRVYYLLSLRCPPNIDKMSSYVYDRLT